LLAILDAVALDEIIAFYETFFVKSPRVMEIQAVSNAHLAENETLKA
jgi:fumarate reductase subunit C